MLFRRRRRRFLFRLGAASHIFPGLQRHAPLPQAAVHEVLHQHLEGRTGGHRQEHAQHAEKAAARFTRAGIVQSLAILRQLDLDLKRSRLDSDLLLQKALCQLALAGGRR